MTDVVMTGVFLGGGDLSGLGLEADQDVGFHGQMSCWAQVAAEKW